MNTIKKPYNKWLPKKGRGRPKKAAVPKAVKSYVKATIHKGIENKYHLAFNPNQLVGSPYILSLVPAINQGNQHSQRIGNRITIMSSYFKFMLNNNIYNATTNPVGGPVMYRYFIISQKKDNSSSFDSGGFFEINNSSTNIQNNQLDQIFKVNSSKYTLHKSGQFCLGTTSTSTNFPAANTAFDNSKMSIVKTIKLTKYITKKIIYDDGGTTPTNLNLWFVLIPTYCNSSTVSGYNPGNITYSIHHHYEDS